MDQTGASRIRAFITKYIYVFLILIAGIVLMALPASEKKEVSDSETVPTLPSELESLQDQLADILSQVEGAGRVKVLLTEASGKETIYQTDTTSSGEDTVILTDSSRNQLGMVSRIDSPVYLGAVIVCQGADRPAVKLAITQAVANATGLSYDRISILKMK